MYKLLEVGEVCRKTDEVFDTCSGVWEELDEEDYGETIAEGDLPVRRKINISAEKYFLDSDERIN